MKICPKCGKLTYYNSYFGAYICEDCNWEDASQGKRRDTHCATYPRTLTKAKYLVKKSSYA